MEEHNTVTRFGSHTGTQYMYVCMVHVRQFVAVGVNTPWRMSNTCISSSEFQIVKNDNATNTVKYHHKIKVFYKHK